jgi:hypothetical protein
MSLYYVQKFLYQVNRDPETLRRFKESRDDVFAGFDLTDEEKDAVRRGDIGLLYVMGVNGQILMHFAPVLGVPWDAYIAAMREGVRKYGPVRAGIYAMTEV